MNKWIAEFDLEDGDRMPEHMDLNYKGAHMWIPVSERLPEINNDGHGPVWKHEVLITGYLSFDDKKETFITTALAEDVRNGCVTDINVIAWMPLPEPYKAESEKWVNFADDLIPIIDEAESEEK